MVADAPLASAAKPPTILVVDDQEVMRDLVVRMLGRAGYTAVAAASGIEALAIFRSGGIDLVVTDIMMPGMSGVELIEALRRIRSGVPVIAVSGAERRTKHLKKALQLGARATLRKPVARAELVTTIRQVMQRASRAAL